MLKIACQNFKKLEVSDLEKNIKNKIYASDAFKLIEENYPNIDIFFIMGADNFIKIMEWKNAKDIIKKYKYIILERTNINVQEYIEKNEYLKKYKENIKIIKNEEHKSCSSSEIRDIIKKKNEIIEDMIQDEVYEYVKKNNIF